MNWLLRNRFANFANLTKQNARNVVKNTNVSPKRFLKILLNVLSLVEKKEFSYNDMFFIADEAKEGAMWAL